MTLDWPIADRELANKISHGPVNEKFLSMGTMGPFLVTTHSYGPIEHISLA